MFDPAYEDLPPTPPNQELQFVFDRLSIHNLKIKITVVGKSDSCHNPPMRLLSDALDSTVGRAIGKVGMDKKVDGGAHKPVKHNYHFKLKDFNLQAEVCFLRSKINCLAGINTNQIMCQTYGISHHRPLCMSPLGCLPLIMLLLPVQLCDFAFACLLGCAKNNQKKNMVDLDSKADMLKAMNARGELKNIFNTHLNQQRHMVSSSSPAPSSSSLVVKAVGDSGSGSSTSTMRSDTAHTEFKFYGNHHRRRLGDQHHGSTHHAYRTLYK